MFLDDDDEAGFDSLLQKEPKQGVGGGPKQSPGGGQAQQLGGGSIWASGPGLAKHSPPGGGFRLDHAMFKNEQPSPALGQARGRIQSGISATSGRSGDGNAEEGKAESLFSKFTVQQVSVR